MYRLVASVPSLTQPSTLSFWEFKTEAKFVVVKRSTLKWSSQPLFVMSRNASHKEMAAHNRISLSLFSQSVKTTNHLNLVPSKLIRVKFSL